MNFLFLEHWHDFVPREGGHVISLAGSGGKTSLMRAIADQLAQEGVPLLLTNTTRSEPLADIEVLDIHEVESAKPGDLPAACYVHAGVEDDGKWCGLTPQQVDRCASRFPDRVILAEVDGAAKHPLKIYREGEPVWPTLTSLALVVTGVNGVGRSAGEAVHRLARSKSGVPDGLGSETIVEWDHLWSLLTAPGGYLAQVPGDVPVVLALAGLGGQADSIGLFEFTSRVMGRVDLPLVVFCETAGETLSLRTACRDDVDGPTS